jgi:hypothetical protein
MAPLTSPAKPELLEFERTLRTESILALGVALEVGVLLRPERGMFSGGGRKSGKY